MILFVWLSEHPADLHKHDRTAAQRYILDVINMGGNLSVLHLGFRIHLGW